MRKVTLEVKVKVIVNLEDGCRPATFIQEMEYDFRSTTGDAEVTDTEILDFEVTDSK